MSEDVIQSAKGFLRTAVLSPLGRLVGAPRVQITSPNTRGGNALYHWLRAYGLDSPRRPGRVLIQDNFAEWCGEFPLIDHLSVTKADVPNIFTEWLGERHDLYGVHFTGAELDAFCRSLIASSPTFQARMERAAQFIAPDVCVVNVRRGDYYEYEHLIMMYGLDIPAFVSAAVPLVEASRYVLVSDDVPWCMEHVAPLLPGPVETTDRRDLFDDFAALTVAHRLILANSTFSFWGAHVGKALGNLEVCVAPPHHFRNEDGTANIERYDPAWIVVPPATVC